VNEEFLDAMKPGAILLNTARGECVDEDALARAHHLGGIGLDVFSREPWDGPHPLAQDPRVQLLPHAAGYHAELGANLTAEIEAAVNAWVRGHPVPHAL